MISAGENTCHWIYPGQKVYFPDGTAVEVKKGDTLGKIAEKHGVAVEDLYVTNPHLRDNPSPKAPTSSIFRLESSVAFPRMLQLEVLELGNLLTFSERAELESWRKFPENERARILFEKDFKGEELKNSEKAELVGWLFFPDDHYDDYYARNLLMKVGKGQPLNFTEIYKLRHDFRDALIMLSWKLGS